MNRQLQVIEGEIPEETQPQEPTQALVDPRSLNLSDAPKQILDQATIAAKALKDVIEKKEKKVMFNGKQYLQFEDWQTIARFYGVTTKITETKYVEYGDMKGFEAKASAVKAGEEVSSAESMCLSDERNWSNKPLFQLKSMAQTRAQAKALRSVLAWVVVLAGYEATPAEEMTGEEKKPAIKEPQRKSQEVPQGPYFTTQYNGNKYICAKVSEVFDAETLTSLGMKQGERNKEIYQAIYDAKIEESLKARLDMIGGAHA